ncbi:hypothetical protein BGW80DRAFT_1255754 [Lactifluus volemus]|nr:hypothetical protein BGW80DRAFT_1255754 [Lactifluus volemus]
MLYIGGGLAAIGAIWYYYTMQESAHTGRESVTAPSQAKASLEDDLPRAADDASRSAKDRTQELLKSGDAKYQQLKSEAELKYERQEIRLVKVSSAASNSIRMQRMKLSTSQLRHAPLPLFPFSEKKADAAKSSWWEWLGWGKSQTKETTDDLRRRANETLDAWNTRFEEAKKKAAEKGEDIKKRADMAARRESDKKTFLRSQWIEAKTPCSGAIAASRALRTVSCFLSHPFDEAFKTMAVLS